RETPELDARIRQLQERVGETSDLAEKAIAMRPQIEELGGRLELLTPRLPLMEELQARLGALSDLSGDIDHRLAAEARHPGGRAGEAGISSRARGRPRSTAQRCAGQRGHDPARARGGSRAPAAPRR